MNDRAARAELSRTSPLTWQQRNGLLVATGEMLLAEIDRGASPVEVRPLFDLLFMLARYQPAGKPPKPAGLSRGRPSKPLSLLFPSKAQKRAMAKRRRPDSAGQRGPVAGSDHETLRPADAKRLRAMAEFMARNDRPVGADAAARRVLRVMPLGDQELGTRYEATAKRLTRAYRRFGYAADMPQYRLHWSIYQALQRGDIAISKELLEL